MQNRQQLRIEMRQRRMALSASEQHNAANALVQQCWQHAAFMRAQHIALYLSNDGEINTKPLIEALWAAGKTLYLPILHPLVPGYLVFQHYHAATPMTANRFGIAEPQLNCSHVKPVVELEIICTPLVAFDAHGQRLGMGGGFYDRTLAQLPSAHPAHIIGLAHSCQQVAKLPSEAWDHPLNAIVTPETVFSFSKPLA